MAEWLERVGDGGTEPASDSSEACKEGATPGEVGDSNEPTFAAPDDEVAGCEGSGESVMLMEGMSDGP